MDYFLESHLPHALQFMVCKHNDIGETDDMLYPDDVMVTIPAGTDQRHVIKINEAQKAFLEEDKQFNKLLALNKGGVRWIDKIPSRMLDEKERLAEMQKKMQELQAENTRLKAGA
jgi:hypothetical protein